MNKKWFYLLLVIFSISAHAKTQNQPTNPQNQQNDGGNNNAQPQTQNNSASPHQEQNNNNQQTQEQNQIEAIKNNPHK